MTEAEIRASAEAVKRIAQKYGVAGWISEGQCREIAAAVIAAHDEVHVAAARLAEHLAAKSNAADVIKR